MPQLADELVRGPLQQAVVGERLQQALERVPRARYDLWRGLYERDQLHYQDRNEDQESQQAYTDKHKERDEHGQPPRHDVGEPAHREREDERHGETAEQDDGDRRREPHNQGDNEETEYDEHGPGAPRDTDRGGTIPTYLGPGAFPGAFTSHHR